MSLFTNLNLRLVVIKSFLEIIIHNTNNKIKANKNES